MYIHHITLSTTDVHLIRQEVVIVDNHTELSNLHVLVQITVHSAEMTSGWTLEERRALIGVWGEGGNKTVKTSFFLLY